MVIDRTNAHEQLAGIWALLPTPFSANLELDLEGLRHNVRFLRDHGVRIFCVACGVGESWSLSADEVLQIAAATRAEAGSGAIVVSGIGDANLRRAIPLAKEMEQSGADLLLLMPPAYPKPEEGAILDYYRAFACATRLPFQIYPIEALPPVSFGLVEHLLDIPNVVSLKDVSLNVSYSYRLQRRFGDQLVIVYGRRGETEARLLYYFSIGMPAYYSNVVNFAPELAINYWQALQRKDVDTVVEIARQLEPYADLFPDVPELGGPVRYRNIQMLKAAMEVCGLPAGPVRPPLVQLGDDERAAVRSVMASVPSAMIHS